MTIEEILKQEKNRLIKNNIEDASIIAKTILQNILKVSRNDILKTINCNIDEKKVAEYKNKIEKIIEGTPFQYITNNQEFMKLPFYVDEDVLIPQPDTEVLVEETINISENENKKEILDICTGSGAIGVSISYYIKDSIVTLSDISERTLNIAKKNAIQNKVEDKIKLIKSNMFDKIENKFDIIVSNPPYIKTDIIKTLDKQVQKEPAIALDGGNDGLTFYKILINEAPEYLKKKGCLCMEIGYDQKNEIIELIKQSNKYKKTYSKKDLSGNDRIVICYI